MAKSLKKTTTKSKIKAVYEIDGAKYTSKTLYEFHLECKNAASRGLISSYEIPNSMNKKARYSTYKPTIDNITFDSLMEAKYYIYLQEKKKTGVIQSFERQVTYELQPKFKKNGKSYRPITYIADFVVTYDDATYVIDTKGKETTEFKLKKKLFEYKFPELHLSIIQYYPETDSWLELDEIKKLARKSKCRKTRQKTA